MTFLYYLETTYLNQIKNTNADHLCLQIKQMSKMLMISLFKPNKNTNADHPCLQTNVIFFN